MSLLYLTVSASPTFNTYETCSDGQVGTDIYSGKSLLTSEIYMGSSDITDGLRGKYKKKNDRKKKCASGVCRPPFFQQPLYQPKKKRFLTLIRQHNKKQANNKVTTIPSCILTLLRPLSLDEIACLRRQMWLGSTWPGTIGIYR